MLLVGSADISNVATNIKVTSSWNNGAGSLTFEYPTYKTTPFPNGVTVVFTYNNANIFYGFLFTTKQNSKIYSCTCYDQIRYLKASNSIMRKQQTLASFVNDVCAQIGDRINLGSMTGGGGSLVKYLFDNKSHLDMIYQSIQDNLVTNNVYCTLYDNFGALDLKDTLDLRLPLVIGDKSLATDFDYSKSIDEDTYNYIKVAKDDKEKGERATYIAKDSGTISKWGKLMLFEKISANMNAAQLAERANQLLLLKNKQTETLKVECIGDTRIRGGSGVKIEIVQADLNIWTIVDSVTHSFTKNQHTMSMNLLFGR